MTLPAPILDDRTFDELRDELVSRISVYLPEWTDLRPSDPGITLLELVAGLGESLLYRFNQIPDQTRLWLLRLLQLLPYPARPASGLVQFTLASQASASADVFEGSTVRAGDVPFRVENDVTVLPFTTTAVVKAKADPPTDAMLRDEYQRVLDAAELDADEAQPYQEVVLADDPGAPGFTALDVESSVDRFLWIAVHADPQTFEAHRTALFGMTGVLSRAPLVIGLAGDTEFPTIDEIDPCEGLTVPPESQRLTDSRTRWCEEPCPDEFAPGPESDGVRPGGGASTLVWQVSVRRDDDPTVPEYLPVTVVRDTTDSLRRDGVVALRLPPARLKDIGVPDLADPDLAGVKDRPPALADGMPVLFWIRVFSRDGTAPLTRLRWAGLNVADAVQVADAPAELVAIGTGLSHQGYPLANGSVLAGTLALQVLENGQWRTWSEIETFAVSRPGDRHYILDADAGRVRCGDGVRGMVFPAGAQIRAASYRYGGGRRGLVKAHAIATTDASGVTVENPIPTAGGEDAEPITSALERIPGELARRDRAVTADDFRALASIPGVARAECLPRFDPTTKRFDAAGVVTVMVWPTADPHHPDAPLADTTLLRAVCSRLDARRLVTTELFVVPATYKPIAISVGLAVKPGFSALGVRRWVELVLRQYLSPLPPFGPDGLGWPLGHRVHAPELEAAAVQVDGVDFIEELSVADLSSGTPVVGTVELAGWEVPEIAEITVVEGPAPAPGSGGVSPPPADAPVPVPVPKDEC
jgi:predicted phage baseplate assembly protein